MKHLIARWVGYLLLAIIAVYFGFIGVAANLESEEIMSDNAVCDFSEIPEQSTSECPCSPEIDWLDNEWRGIKINLPETVQSSGGENGFLNSETTRVPVYLLLQFTLDRLAKYDLEREGITLIFIDQKTGKSFVNNLFETNSSIPTEADAIPEEEMKARVIRLYYNINALEYVELPDNEATYDVYATFEEFKSNVMTLEMK